MPTARLNHARPLDKDSVSPAVAVLRRDRTLALTSARYLLWTVLASLFAATALVTAVAALTTT